MGIQKKTFQQPPSIFLVEMNQNHKLVIAVHGLRDGFIPFVLDKRCVFFFLSKTQGPEQEKCVIFVQLMEILY